MIDFTPLADQYRVRQVAPDTHTPGGLALPETTLHVTNEAEVIAAGPGTTVPALGTRAPMQAEPGDHVVYLAPDWSPTVDGEGALADDQLVGLVDTGTGEVEPLNDWVKLTAPVMKTHSPGGLALPEAWQRRDAKGTVLAVGPGRRRPAGPLQGTRKSVADILNREAPLVGCTVWWSRQEETLSLAQPSGEPCMFVRADMLMAVEE